MPFNSSSIINDIELNYLSFIFFLECLIIFNRLTFNRCYQNRHISSNKYDWFAQESELDTHHNLEQNFDTASKA